MKRVEAHRYLIAADELLEPLGFRRKMRNQEWRRVVDPNHTDWIHLHFGRAGINPSLRAPALRTTDFVTTSGYPSFKLSIAR